VTRRKKSETVPEPRQISIKIKKEEDAMLWETRRTKGRQNTEREKRKGQKEESPRRDFSR